MEMGLAGAQQPFIYKVITSLGNATEVGKSWLPHKLVQYSRVCMTTPTGWPDARSNNAKVTHNCVNMGQGLA